MDDSLEIPNSFLTHKADDLLQEDEQSDDELGRLDWTELLFVIFAVSVSISPSYRLIGHPQLDLSYPNVGKRNTSLELLEGLVSKCTFLIAPGTQCLRRCELQDQYPGKLCFDIDVLNLNFYLAER